MDRKEIDFKFLYPNLIIFLGSSKNESLFKQLDKSFKEFQYGPIFKQERTCYKHELGREVSTCRIMQGAGIPICLADGEGTLPCDAEQQAVESLLNKLCDSCYVIKANQQYFTRKNIPTFALNADPSQSHVYKVVFLRTNSRGAPFPKPVCGAIDYVETYNELMAYIETHTRSDTKADLFILNVLKTDRARIRQVLQTNGLSVQFLVGCSDMGIYAYRNMSTLLILQSLLKDGGRNVKYKLIGPRDKYGDNEDKFDGKVAAGVVQSEEEEEIVINQWIADHLVVMEIVTEWNELESTKRIIGESVRDCPDTQEFIIEKNRNNAGMILADALIDRNVVGRARGFKLEQVKAEAAENAMKNLMKCCYYIQAKKSYFGSSRDVPYFLQQPTPVSETKIYRIADKRKGLPNKILQQFKSSWQEDLYFLNDFTAEEKNQIDILAKKLNFLVRWLGRESYLCVYKKRKPNEVLKQLLSTRSKENEKYKLITPPSKIHEQGEGSATQQNWNNQGMSHGAQANIQPINRGQGSYNPPSVTDTRANFSDYQSPYVDHGSASQSFEQETEAPGEENKETPDWVMKFIQSAPIKPRKPPKMSRPVEPQRRRDDVYNRYKFKFIAPKIIPPPVTNSNVNFRGADQRPHQNAKKGPTNPPSKDSDVYNRYKFKFIAPKIIPPPVTNSNVNFRGADQRPHQNAEKDPTNPPSKDSEHGSTLSERLQRLLEEQNLSNRQDVTKQVPSTTSNKRPYDQGPYVKEECEPSEKISKPSTNTYSSHYNSSVGSSEFKGEPSNNFSTGQMSELSVQKPRTWGSNDGNSGLEDWSRTGKSYDRSFTNDPGFKEEDGPKHDLFTMSDTQLNSLRRRNPFDEGSSVTVKNESGKSNCTQHNNPHWNQGTKQHFDQRPNTSTGGQRNLTSLFDYSGCQDDASQGVSRPTFPARPPPPWKKNKQFRGHKFSKLEKYGKKK